MKIKLFAYMMLFVSLLTGCGGGGETDVPDWKDARPAGMFFPSRDSVQTTAGGVKVFGKEGVSNQYLTDLDAGFDEIVSLSDGLSLTQRIMTKSVHEVYTTPWKCEPSPEGRVMSWRARADSYDGSEFDFAFKTKYSPPREVTRTNWDGTTWVQLLHSEPDGIGGIYIAEQVMNIGTEGSVPPVPQSYLCLNDDQPKLKFRFALDHIFLANSTDQRVLDYFTATITHWGGGHPLIPMPSGARGLEKPAAVEQLLKQNDATITDGDMMVIKQGDNFTIIQVTK